MADKITFADKESGVVSSFPIIQKWRFQDANETKDVVNSHADDIEAVEATAAANTSDISTNTTDISTNTSDILTNASNLAQEVIDRVAGDAGTANIHSDIDLEDSVTPIDGWVAKRIGGVLSFAMKEYAFYNGAPIINTTANTPDPATPFFWDFDFQRVGTYMVGVAFSHSYDVVNSSIVVVPTLGGNTIAVIANGEMMRKEPKESGGNDGDGRGTSQKEIGGMMYFPVTVGAIGVQEFRLEHFGTAGGVEASLWNVSVIVEEIFNPQIKN